MTRQSVVDAAVRLADAEGLAAVSIRRVATELGARTMSLYSHIDSKDDLLDLMREQAAAETVVGGALPRDWRAASLAIARRERATALRHPWLIRLLGNPGHPGPNQMRHLEQSVTALSGLTTNPLAALRICAAIDEFVLGHVIGEVTRTPAGAFTQPHTRALLSSGDYPILGRLLSGGPPSLDDTFERGLTWLLDGIEAAHR
jgi:AcrR family transcriptional regulator